MRSSRSCVYIIQYKNACIIWMIWIVNSWDRASMIFQHDVHRFKHNYVRDSSPKRLHCCSYLNLATGSIDFSLFLCWFSIKSTLKKNWTTINIPVFLLLSLYGFSIFTNNSKWYEPFIYIYYLFEGHLSIGIDFGFIIFFLFVIVVFVEPHTHKKTKHKTIVDRLTDSTFNDTKIVNLKLIDFSL